MKKLILLSISMILFGCIQVYGQNPVPDPDTIPDPVQEGDPAVRHLPPRTDYADDRKQITEEEIPEPVRQALESDPQYVNWKKGVIFHDREKDQYVVEFQEGGKTTTHRFSKDGKPVLQE